jgi:hypothetical protein
MGSQQFVPQVFDNWSMQKACAALFCVTYHFESELLLFRDLRCFRVTMQTHVDILLSVIFFKVRLKFFSSRFKIGSFFYNQLSLVMGDTDFFLKWRF